MKFERGKLARGGLLMVRKPYPARTCFFSAVLLQFLFICAALFISTFFYFFVGVMVGGEGAVREQHW